MQGTSLDPRLIIGVVIVLLILAIGVAMFMRERRKKTVAGLRSRFGPEYDRTVRASGSERAAATDLSEREARVQQLDIRELSAAERERFITDWKAVQSRFIDHPKGAVIEADEVISALMQARGYPVADFEQRAADISVKHPRIVQYYRTAHTIAVRLGRDEATTEDMRTAMIQYRTLVDELLHLPAPAGVRAAIA